MESSPETSTRSTPDSPIIGLIVNSTILSPNEGMPDASKEPTSEVPAPTPSAAVEGISNAAGSGSDNAEGSKNPTVRLVPFQSMPQSTQEELGKELFDDPLLSIDNMKKTHRFYAMVLQIYQGEPSSAASCMCQVVW